MDSCIVQTSLAVESISSCSKDWQTEGASGVWTCVPGAADTFDRAVGAGVWEAGGATQSGDGNAFFEAVVRAPELLVPQAERTFLTLRHAFAFDAGGAVVELADGQRSATLVPVGGFSAKIAAPGTSLDGCRGFTGRAAFRPWQVDVFDMRRWAGRSVRLSFRVAVPSRGGPGLPWRIDQFAVVGGKPCERFTPDAALRRRSVAALSLIESAHRLTTEVAWKTLPPGERRELVDRFLWYGVDPMGLSVPSWIRGVAGGVSARGLAYDPAPGAAQTALEERAVEFLSGAGGGIFGAARGAGDLWPTATSKLTAAGEMRFQQVFAGYPVDLAFVQVSFDEAGRVESATSTYVPELRAPVVPTIPQVEAEKAAVAFLLDERPPMWAGADPFVEASTLVAVNTAALGGAAEDHLAFRVGVADRNGSGRQDVWIDAADRTVLGHLERTELLDENDAVLRAAGEIAGSVPPTLDTWIWHGAGGGGAGTCFDAGLCATNDARRMMRGIATLHELVAERGAEAAPGTAAAGGDPYWTWPGLVRLWVGIGARGVASIGLNQTNDDAGSCAIFAAADTAVIDLLGHEYGHSLTGHGDDFVMYAPSDAHVEKAAIEEHLGDVVGALAKQRSSDRSPGEETRPGWAGNWSDVFTLADEPDAMAGIGSVTHSVKPCTWSDAPAFWRSLRNPDAPNGGWCEGSTHVLEQFFNAYDAYGFAQLPEESASGGMPGCVGERNDNSARQYVPGHASVGVGNRFAYLLLDGSEAWIDNRGFRVLPLGFDAGERVFFHGMTHMSAVRDWTSYADGWHRGARDVEVSPPGAGAIGPREGVVRTATASVGIWNEPVRFGAAGTGWRTLDASRKPAAAAVPFEREGRVWTRRFIVHVRNSLSPGPGFVEYYWWDEPPADTAEAFPVAQGPCAVTPRPEGGGSGTSARTNDDPTASRAGDGLLVAWRDARASSTAGQIIGAFLPASSIAATSVGCPVDWLVMNPPVARSSDGAPSLATWSPGGLLLQCTTELGGIPVPYPVGELTPRLVEELRDCFEIDERPRDPGRRLVEPREAREEVKTLREILDFPTARATPSLFDPLAPVSSADRTNVGSVQVPVDRFVGQSPQAAATLTSLSGAQGQSWRKALQRPGPGQTRWTDAVFRIGTRIGEQGDFDGYTYFLVTLEEPMVVLAFRKDDNVYLVPWDSATATDALDPLAEDVEAVDPTLAVVDVQRPEDVAAPFHAYVTDSYLYAFYIDDVTVEGYDPTPLHSVVRDVLQNDHLFYRAARTFVRDVGLTMDDFGPARDISAIVEPSRRYYGAIRPDAPPRWFGHVIDYQHSRTRRSPAAVGADEILHVFVVARDLRMFGTAHRYTCDADGSYVLQEAEAVSVSPRRGDDFLRWGALRPVWPDGELLPYGQRFIPVWQTAQPTLPELDAESSATSGVPWWDSVRHVVSFAHPDAERSRFEVRRIPSR